MQANFRAIDEALRHLHEVPVPGSVTATVRRKSWELPQEAPEFVRTVTARMLALEGDSLPVSALPADGTFPVGTTKWEKRNIAQEVPVWDPELCIQCGKCVLVCPHAAIRANVYDAAYLEGAPEGFKSAPARWQGPSGDAVHAAGRSGGLHGLLALRRGCPVRKGTGSSR